jgi:hypothetical protein
MRKLLALLLVALACMGCGPTTQETIVHDAIVASNTTASLIDALQTSALVLYKFEQERAIVTAAQLGEGKAQAVARVQVVRNAWAPVWDAFSRARLAHETLATLLASGAASSDAIRASQSAVEDRMIAAQALLGQARARTEEAP